MNTYTNSDRSIANLVISLLLFGQLCITSLTCTSSNLDNDVNPHDDAVSPNTLNPNDSTDFYYGTLVLQAQIIIDNRSMNINEKYNRIVAIKEEITHGLPHYEACQALEAVNEILDETRKLLPFKTRTQLFFKDNASIIVPASLATAIIVAVVLIARSS